MNNINLMAEKKIEEEHLHHQVAVIHFKFGGVRDS